jgi:hypothetical protein
MGCARQKQLARSKSYTKFCPRLMPAIDKQDKIGRQS